MTPYLIIIIYLIGVFLNIPMIRYYSICINKGMIEDIKPTVSGAIFMCLASWVIFFLLSVIVVTHTNLYVSLHTRLFKYFRGE